ncbi:GNAT family N-acetyltransferase [Dyadobacter subterraneus]|uniref:GNAT family N-acetyltransferase n=1 Tax=Dyadobacter subterraneus TaxID=2773304 RepID=A0ABR9WC48_9BACT|nr:GNAT family N-acetyltransferase [Dyadobacter subterraneus]MBE9463007.1 GNAT family N-acetyltransferase [Dyadobacter subterraneus]
MKIVGYKPEYQVYFKEFNISWLEEYFSVEPFDNYAFENPEEAILKDGGRIIFAENDDEIIGTVALKYAEPGVFEMAKMAVRKDARGLGAGKLLCTSIVEIARNMKATRLILYSNKQLKPAIAMYLQMGFTEIPLEPGLYKRADIKMELVF